MGGDRRLTAGGIVYAVIQQQMLKIGRSVRAHRGEGAQAHQRRAIAVQRDHPQVRSSQRETQRQRHHATHRAHHVQLIRPIVDRVQLATAEAGRCQHRGGATGVSGDHLPQRLLP